jgi:phosphoribosylamine--glycine ligase
MNILLLGAGGREHALAWKISQSPLCTSLFIAPGNAGTKLHGTNLSFSVTDFERIRETCITEQIDMVIVGPEEPLVKGIVDFLRNSDQLRELMIIGPSEAAARLEGSKSFAKSFMKRHNIPTAAHREFTEENFTEGIEYLKQHELPIVLKADGLAAGKGVIICQNHVEAVAEFELMIQRSKFGAAGKKVVVEEFLTGIELSVFILTDGKHFALLPEAKDYKRIGEGDTGLNTGGMGAISPVPFADDVFMKKVRERIVEPTVRGLQNDGLDYQGFIFAGLIRVGTEPFVIEYNCRLGDPETEVVIPRIKNDLVELLRSTALRQLDTVTIEKDPRFATTIVAVSGGYPNDYEKGFEITGLDTADESTWVFHSGTIEKENRILTSGGRVVCATALGSDIEDALERSRSLVERISFEGKYFRRDIGFEFVSTSHAVNENE